MKIKCPACSAVLNIPDSAAGKVVKCPCGKQLRAPGGAANPAANPGGAAAARPTSAATPTRTAAPRPARQPAGAAMGDFDAAMFDELTDDDLQQPVRAVSRPGGPAGPIPASTNPYAVGAAGAVPAAGGNGRIAGIGQRIAGAVVDLLFTLSGFLAAGILIALMAPAADGVGDEAAAGIGLIFLLVSMFLIMIPILINFVLISMTAQSIGKKLVKTRIVDKASGTPVGFVQGVLMRNIVFGVITSVPLIGGFIALADLVYLFTQGHETLHDKLAKTVVVEA